MPLRGEQIALRLRIVWRWWRTVAGPWLTDRRPAVSHVALLTVAAVSLGAGVLGVVGQTSGPAGSLTYLTPPDPLNDQTLRLRVDPAPTASDESATAAPVATTAAAAYLTHEVQAGDTLYGIAAQYGVDAQYLLWNNSELTNNPDLLIIGASVLVPTVDGIVYDVRLGDTINALAATYDVDPDDVVNFAPNGLDSPDHIIEGSVLLLPGAVPPPPPPPPPAPEPAPGPLAPPATGPLPAGIAPAAAPAVTPVSFIWPLNGTLWGGFGPRWGSFHKGIDIGANAGTAVTAAASGQVVLSTYSDNGYGSYIIVQHADGSETLYAHLSERYVELGQYVGQGEVIGAVGCTGWCNGNHLHFEVHIGGPVDPLSYLP